MICQGANPGLVSQLLKAAVLDLAWALGQEPVPPVAADGWARLFRDLDIRTIHIAEHDSQVSRTPRAAGEFVGTWSVDGFLGEGAQPAELGWGTHEPGLPADAAGTPRTRRDLPPAPGRRRARAQLGAGGRPVRRLSGHPRGIALDRRPSDLREGGLVVYRPTVHYAYCPCPDLRLSLHELLARGFAPQARQRILGADIVSGQDELGLLLAGHPCGAYWFGSQLTIEAARAIVPHANATALQVAAGILGGIAAAVEQPALGLVEPEELDFRRVLAVARPYLGRPRRLVGLDTAHRPRPAVPRRWIRRIHGGSSMSELRDRSAVSTLERRRPGLSRPEAYRYLAMLMACPYLYLGQTAAPAWGCSPRDGCRPGQ